MIINYYTLKKIANESKSLIGSRIANCYSQEKNSLLMIFYDGANEHYLQFNSASDNASIYLRKEFSRARKNTVNLFECLIDEVLQEFYLLPNDRIIVMKFIHTTVYCYLFGGSKNNIVVVNDDGFIIDSFKSSKKLIGNEFNLPEANQKQLSDFPRDFKIVDALARSMFQFGKTYANELLGRMNIEENRIIDTFEFSELALIEKQSQVLQKELQSSTKFYILERDDKPLLSLILLSKYPNIIEQFSKINEAVFRRIITTIKGDTFSSQHKKISLKLNKKKEKLERSIILMKDDTSYKERSRKYKLWAELLNSQANVKQKGNSEIILNDYENNKVIIQLDNKRSLMDNANKYYEKARNSIEENRIRKKRLPDIELQLLKVESAINKLSEAKTIKELQKLHKNLKEKSGVALTESQENITKFREFELGEGYILYVGKNAANNDELTMRFAKPNDLWFHARGSGGSHTVLRVNKGQKPPKYIIKKAASIAAYYSKARKAKYTPVAYTFKKYVRKPKGANIGSVVMGREEVIMVEPKLPDQGGM